MRIADWAKMSGAPAGQTAGAFAGDVATGGWAGAALRTSGAGIVEQADPQIARAKHSGIPENFMSNG